METYRPWVVECHQEETNGSMLPLVSWQVSLPITGSHQHRTLRRRPSEYGSICGLEELWADV